MLFNSFSFLIFLPIVFSRYWFVFKPLKWQNLLVVVASYVFYGWWDWRFLILIAFTSACSYISGIQIEKYEGKKKVQRWISTLNIAVNLLILCIFKYYNFFVDSLDSIIVSTFGSHLDWPTLTVILPVGISFYTFQALSYSIDVYRGKMRASHDVISFFAFISFFPQLVAGPIERATNLLPQFQKSRTFDYSQAVDGCRQMLWGFLKKMVVADSCAGAANTIWSTCSDQSSFVLLIGALFFTFQIYCDFSGYSDIAIGTAKLFGIRLMRNFNVPYFSRNISEFWRRWHISLMKWFTDYIYIPLGGSRCARWKVIRNVFIVFVISGLWHGANWTFVVWGFYHAVLMTIFMLLHLNTKYEHVVAWNKWLPTVKELFQMAITFFLVVIGWVIFRAETIEQAFTYLSRMFTMSIFSVERFDGLRAFGFALIILFIEWLQRDKQHALEFPKRQPFNYRFVRWCSYFLVIMMIVLYSGGDQTFIYFQF